ncbi:MAG: hypothetical protein KDC95_13530 [Planctomycetes bacterium]|nr:hypothetical protein [Planctomycetota bacterium]
MTSTTDTTNRKTAVRDKRGRFLKGNPGGPGREKGFNDKLDFLYEVKRWAAQQGTTIHEVAAAVAGAVIRKALDGDIAAQRLACDRLFGVLPREPLVAVQNNNTTLKTDGPPPPPPAEFSAYLSRMIQLVSGGESLEIIDAETADSGETRNGYSENTSESTPAERLNPSKEST